MTDNLTFKTDTEGLKNALLWINSNIEKLNLDRKEQMQSELIAEESLVALARHATNNDIVEISLIQHLKSTYLYISAKGSELTTGEIATDTSLKDIAEQTDNIRAQAYIQKLMVKAYANLVNYSNKNGVNTVKIQIHKNRISSTQLSLCSIGLAIVLGLILRNFGNEGITNVLCESIFSPIQTILMNLLFCVVGPVVFFSIISATSSFSDITSLGKVGIKVFATYIATSVSALLISVGLVQIFKPGTFGSVIVDSVMTSDSASITFKNALLGIVPSNLLQSFLDDNMLQLILIAILIGICINTMGQYSKILHELFEAFNALFLQMMKLVCKTIPLLLFVSISTLMITTDIRIMKSLGQMMLLYILSTVCVLVLYCLILLINGINPLIFIKKYLPTGISIGFIQSSNAGIPINMEACEQLGISKKIYAFSIPLGATINMDGNVIASTIVMLTFARMCGINMPPAAMITFCLTIILMSVVTPGVPGAALSMWTILFTTIGLPASIFPLAITMHTLIDTPGTFSNVTGDVVASLVVAKSEHQLDMEIFKKK